MKRYLIALAALALTATAADACGPLSRVVNRVQERRGVFVARSSARTVVRGAVPVPRTVPSVVIPASPCPPGGCPLPKAMPKK